MPTIRETSNSNSCQTRMYCSHDSVPFILRPHRYNERRQKNEDTARRYLWLPVWLRGRLLDNNMAGGQRCLFYPAVYFGLLSSGCSVHPDRFESQAPHEFQDQFCSFSKLLNDQLE